MRSNSRRSVWTGGYTTRKGPAMTREKPEQTNAPSGAHKLEETELIRDLEIDDAEDADAVKGGSGGAGAGKITFNPFQITR